MGNHIAVNTIEGWVKVKDDSDTLRTYRKSHPYTEGPRPSVLNVSPDGNVLPPVNEERLRDMPNTIIVGEQELGQVAAEMQRQGRTAFYTRREYVYVLEG